MIQRSIHTVHNSLVMGSSPRGSSPDPISSEHRLELPFLLAACLPALFYLLNRHLSVQKCGPGITVVSLRAVSAPRSVESPSPSFRFSPASVQLTYDVGADPITEVKALRRQLHNMDKSTVVRLLPRA